MIANCSGAKAPRDLSLAGGAAGCKDEWSCHTGCSPWGRYCVWTKVCSKRDQTTQCLGTALSDKRLTTGRALTWLIWNGIRASQRKKAKKAVAPEEPCLWTLTCLLCELVLKKAREHTDAFFQHPPPSQSSWLHWLLFSTIPNCRSWKMTLVTRMKFTLVQQPSGIWGLSSQNCT